MTNTIRTKSDIIKSSNTQLDSYEANLQSADNCTNKVALDIHDSIKLGFFSPSKIKSRSDINPIAEKYCEEFLQHDWKKMAKLKKDCIKKAMPIAIALDKKGMVVKNDGKEISPTGGIFVKGNSVDPSLNKDNYTTVALNFKQLSNLANKELNIVEGKNKSSKLELACSKVLEVLEDCPQDKNDNWVFSSKELSKMTMLEQNTNQLIGSGLIKSSYYKVKRSEA